MREQRKRDLKKMERLIGKEIAMYELDNEMVNLGFMSEGECIGQREVVESECVSYTKKMEKNI